MKNVSGCSSVNVLSYVFNSELFPSNSSAAWPSTAFRRMIGASLVANEVRSRPNPLLSAQLVTASPSAYAVVSASYQSWSPFVTGGVGDAALVAWP